jgi:O-antigen ligase
VSSILDHVGGTPLVALRLARGLPVLAKCEHLNPGGSVKDRIAVAIVDDAAARLTRTRKQLMRERVRSLGNFRDTTIRERAELWGESLRMVKESPWLGLGVNTYARNEPLYKKEGSQTDKQYAHNGYLQIAAETGLLGLSSFLAAVVYLWFASLKAFLRAPNPFLRAAGLGLLCGILAFLIHSATDTDLQSTLLVNTLWLAMGMAWAGKRLSTKGQ